MNKKHTYGTILAEHDALQQLEGTVDKPLADNYYTVRETFKNTLKEVLNEEFLKTLNLNQLIKFISWCSTYRPAAPHIILLILSKLDK